jgi:hypothetical protein
MNFVTVDVSIYFFFYGGNQNIDSNKVHENKTIIEARWS